MAMSVDNLSNVFLNFERRLQLCLRADERHFEQYLSCNFPFFSQFKMIELNVSLYEYKRSMGTYSFLNKTLELHHQPRKKSK